MVGFPECYGQSQGNTMKTVLLSFTVMMLFGSCVEQDVIGIPPGSYELKQNAPNPFSDTTLVQYGIPSVGTNPLRIRVAVYNRFNDRIFILRDSSSHPAGMFNLTWRPGGSQPAGIYYIDLQQMDIFGSATTVKRVAVLKQ